LSSSGAMARKLRRPRRGSTTTPRGCDPKSGHRLGGGLALAGAQAIADARLEDGALVVQFGPGGETRRVALAALAERGQRRVRAPQLWATEAEMWRRRRWVSRLTDGRWGAARGAGQGARRGLAFVSGAGTEPGVVERLTARSVLSARQLRPAVRRARRGGRPPPGLHGRRSRAAYGQSLSRSCPTLQVLHVIEAATEGGESQFADGFAHAAALKADAAGRASSCWRRRRSSSPMSGRPASAMRRERQ